MHLQKKMNVCFWMRFRSYEEETRDKEKNFETLMQLKTLGGHSNEGDFFESTVKKNDEE